MNKRDLLERAFYNSYNPERSKGNMEKLTRHANEKNVNVFDTHVLEESVKSREYIHKILYDSLINSVKEDYNLPTDFEVSTIFRDREDFNANMEREISQSNEYIIFVDDLLDTFVFRLSTVLLYWNDFIKDHDVWTCCFMYTLYTLTEFGVHRVRPACPRWIYEMQIEMLTYSDRASHLYADVASIIMSFVIAHELGHFVLGHHDSAERSIEAEFAADDFAYKVILSLIEKQSKHISVKGERPEIDMYSDYTYLAPLMFFDFMQLLEHFSNAVYNDYSRKNITAELNMRKEHLEEWVFNSPNIYDFETDGGNAVYNATLSSIERFMSEVDLKLQRGKNLIPEVHITSHVATSESERVPTSE